MPVGSGLYFGASVSPGSRTDLLLSFRNLHPAWGQGRDKHILEGADHGQGAEAGGALGLFPHQAKAGSMPGAQGNFSKDSHIGH